MAGKKGQKWAEKKERYPVKMNTAVSQKVGDAIQAKAIEKDRSVSAIIRKVLDKIFG